MLRGERYGEGVDVFSLALILLELTTKTPPYTDHRRGKHRRTHEIAVGGLRPTIPTHVDADYAALIEDAWHGEASQRPTAAEMLGVSLEGGSGRVLVGVLEVPAVSAP